MEFFKKNKLIVGVILVIIVILSGFLIYNYTRSQSTQTTLFDEEKQVKQVDPSEIGLELSLRSDKKAVIIRATKLSGIASLEYELTYDAEVTEGGDTHAVPRGAIGKLTIRNGEANAEVDLGTCSANVCKYDKVVSDIKVIVRVNYESGEVGQVEDAISPED